MVTRMQHAWLTIFQQMVSSHDTCSAMQKIVELPSLVTGSRAWLLYRVPCQQYASMQHMKLIAFDSPAPVHLDKTMVVFNYWLQTCVELIRLVAHSTV